MLSNLDKDGNPSGKHPDRGTLYWHTDGSWKERTGQATMMYSEIVPPRTAAKRNSPTCIRHTSCCPTDIKEKIEGRRASTISTFSRTRRHGEDPLTAEQKAEGAAGVAPNPAHASRDRAQGDLPRRPCRIDRGHAL